MKTYLLTEEPWIPIMRHGGETAEVSLFELFAQGEEIHDLSLPPAQRIAIMRLLLCISYRALGPAGNRREWHESRAGIAGAAATYLKKWEAAFNLYGDHPFLQAKGLEITGNATLDKLDFALASGSNHTLFDHLAHENGRRHSAAWQARMLLVTQNFSTGGTIGANCWNGVKTGDLTGNISSPAVEGSPLHTFLIGENILDTLHLNMIPTDELGTLPFGVPVWEIPVRNSNEAQQFRTTLLGRLAPISRAVELPEDGTSLTLAVGCNYAQLPEFFDPYLASRYNAKTQMHSYLRVQSNRNPWRELESLLALHPNTENAVRQPKHLKNRFEIGSSHTISLWCGGVAVDKAKYEFAGEWTFSFQVAALWEDESLLRLDNLAHEAEELAGHLSSSIGIFWKNLDCKTSGESLKITAGREKTQIQTKLDFWTAVNAKVSRFIATGSPEEFETLRRDLNMSMEKFFTANLPVNSPRGMLALGKTLPEFKAKLRKITAKFNPKKEN